MGMEEVAGGLVGGEMMDSGASAPSYPDPQELMRQQFRYNRINTTTPFGQINYEMPEDGGNASASVELSPEQQAILNNQMAARQSLSQQLASEVGGIDVGGQLDLSDMPEVNYDRSAARQEAQNAVYDNAMSQMQPQWERQQDELYQTLADRGLPAGSEAFNSAMSQFNEDRNRSMQQAAYQSVQAGNQAASSELQNELAARQQGVSEAVTRRQVPFNELQAALSNSQVQRPQSTNATPIDVQGAYGPQINANNMQYQTQQANKRNQMSGLANIGSAAAMAAMGSSRDFKTDDAPPETILRAVEQLPVRSWRYKPRHRDDFGESGGEQHIGPYAEDFNALFNVGDGKRIPVQSAIGVCLRSIQELAAENRELRRRIVKIEAANSRQ